MLNLFKHEGDDVIVDPVVFNILEFKKLKSKARSKEKVKQLFAYLYYTTDYRSPYMKVDEKDRVKSVMEGIGLKGYNPDETMEHAVIRYKELSETPTIKALKESVATLNTFTSMLGLVRKSCDDAIVKSSMLEADEVFDVEETLKQLKLVIELQQKIPTTISTIKTLEEQVKAEQSTTSKIKGGGEVGEFED